MLSKYSKTHEAFFASSYNEVVGKINSRYNGVFKYLALAENNKILAIENASLRNQLKTDYFVANTTTLNVIDTVKIDSVNTIKKYTYLPAQVANNNFSSQTNYITLERGSNQGVKKDMSVISSTGVVGRVVEVSANYSIVLSLINRNSIITGKVKNKEAAGNIEWDGKSPSVLIMKKVPKTAVMAKGDSVVTGNYSASFPPNLLIGTVLSWVEDKSTGNYEIKLKSATNFYTLQHVNIIANNLYNEQASLEQKKLPFLTYNND